MELGRSVVPGGHLKHSLLSVFVVSDSAQAVQDDWPEPCAILFTGHALHGVVAVVPTLIFPGEHFVQKGVVPWSREEPAGQPHSASSNPYFDSVAEKIGFEEL